MPVFNEGRHPGEFILSEARGTRSRESVLIAASQTIEPGGILAKLAVAGGVAVTQAFAGTGDGVLTLADPAVSTKVKDGVYTIVCITAGADAGTFRVEDPDGVAIGSAVVGVAFNKAVKFTIADGAADFVVGDTFYLTVAISTTGVSWVAFNHGGTDGSEIPAGIAIYGAVTGAGETAKIAAMVRDAEVNGNCIAWPAAIGPGGILNAEQFLADELGIIVRN